MLTPEPTAFLIADISGKRATSPGLSSITPRTSWRTSCRLRRVDYALGRSS